MRLSLTASRSRLPLAPVLLCGISTSQLLLASRPILSRSACRQRPRV